MSQYQTIKTQAGLGLEAGAETGGPAIKLVSMSVGDGGGKAVQPSAGQTGLVHEVDRVNLNSLSQNSTDATQWVAEAVFPADHGGYTVREVGLWTDGGVLFAVANFPDTYKPAPSEGTAGQLLISLNFRAQNSDNITLVVDGNLQLATREWTQGLLEQERARASSAEAKLQPAGDYATNASLQQEVQRAQAAEGKLQPAGDYATNSSLQQEIQRAQAAEAGLLPLTGGTITGPINRAGGGVLPEVIGPNLTGRAVIQAFTATGQTSWGDGHEAWVSFPASFTPGTVPVISIAITRETGGDYVSRFAPIGVYLNTSTPHINNTGFSFQPAYIKGGEVNTSGGQWTVQVIAIGVMQ
ncbi:phage tail protein [Bombella pollinis]|uniref:Phage tail protein n=1 Tax=Bombella pollinis TaxID=2967337 RepID=A0ABT3WN15_9PROT|nr:phage tail protein [Bombella pollinis]MCX5620500.1 phage tail protein [Bombella pollinis]